MAEFNHLYAKEWSPSQVLKALLPILREDRDQLIECIHQGITDGSLHPDLDPDLTMAAIYNFNSSLLVRLGQMGTKIQEEYGIGADKITSEIYRIFLNGIKTKPDSQKNKLKAKPRKNSSRKARTGKSKRQDSK